MRKYLPEKRVQRLLKLTLSFFISFFKIAINDNGLFHSWKWRGSLTAVGKHALFKVKQFHNLNIFKSRSVHCGRVQPQGYNLELYFLAFNKLDIKTWEFIMLVFTSINYKV